jgi:hypothetical protein
VVVLVLVDDTAEVEVGLPVGRDQAWTHGASLDGLESVVDCVAHRLVHGLARIVSSEHLLVVWCVGGTIYCRVIVVKDFFFFGKSNARGADVQLLLLEIDAFLILTGEAVEERCAVRGGELND